MTDLGSRRVAITGATGLVGSALAAALRAGGNEVVAISRTPGPGRVVWDPLRRTIDLAGLQGVNAVVHLAGENLAGARWTAPRKELLRSSRIGPTQWLAGVLAGLSPRPAVLVSASAVGIYGSRADELLSE
ncbi:MAG: NAD-dependent epimerase/dehydratase family protein, partial [Gemmatimonadota bacterium]